MFCDQTPQAINKLFNRDQTKIDRYNTTRRTEHAANISYRIFYALRNHIQHAGYIVNQLSYTYTNVTEGERQNDFDVSPMIDVLNLLEDADLKNEIIADLKSLGPKFDIMNFVKGYVDAILLIQSDIRDMIKADHERRMGLILAYEKRGAAHYGFRPGTAPGDYSAVSLDKNGEIVEKYWVSDKFVNRYKKLVERNTQASK